MGDPTDTAYYVVSALSMAGSLLVMLSIASHGVNRSCFTFLLICFHLSLLGEEIATLPDVYTSNGHLCVAMQFFHFYFSLMNIVVVVMLVEAHRSSILEDPFQSRAKILKYGIYVILLFPLITLLPFVDGTYTAESSDADGDDDTRGWCTPPNRVSWSIGVYFIWVWLFLILIVVLFSNSLYRIYQRDKAFAKTFSTTIGLYVIISIVSWIPRAFERFIRYNDPSTNTIILFIAYLPINISGILYVFVYIREKRYIVQYTETVEDIAGAMSFSWERGELMEMMRGSSTTRMTEMASSPSISVQNPIARNTASGTDHA